MSDNQGGEGLHGWAPLAPLACLAMANDRIKAEPFGPYMRCVLGTCECKAAAQQAYDPHFGKEMADGYR